MNNSEEIVNLFTQLKNEIDKLDDDIKAKMVSDVETTIRMAFLDQLTREGQDMGDYEA